MRICTAVTTLLLTAALVGVTGCGQSYEDKTESCAKALKTRAKDDSAKPSACNGVKEDDYGTLVIGNVIDQQGWVDDDGNVDMNKLLDDATADDDN